MSASVEEMKEMLVEADARGDTKFATKLMDMIEASGDATAQPDELPEGDLVDAFIEPAQALASSIAGSVSGGYQGLAEAVNPYAEKGAGARKVQDVQQDYSEMGAPETQAGQRGLETVQDLIETGIDWARFPISGLGGLVTLLKTQDAGKASETIKNIQEQGLGKTMGNATMESTDSPILATLAEMSPDLVETFLGLGALKGVKGVGKTGEAVSDAVTTPRLLNPDVNPMAIARTQKGVEFKQKIADDIRAGSTDSSVAKYILDGAGKVKSDPIATEAIKQGFDPAVVSAIKGANPVDKQKMLQMLDHMKRSKENARFAMDNRPSDIAGESLMQRVRYVRDVNKDSGKALDGIAKGLRGQYADFQPSINNFMEGLDEMGIQINGKTLTPNFEGSILQGKGLNAPQNVIKNIVERLAKAQRSGVTPDAYDMHMLKKYIDENVTYGGKGGEGLKGKTERLMKKLRTDIDGALDEKFPEYNQVNTTYSDTRGALDALQDTAGRKMDLGGVNADKATGTLLRRLMSNYSNRVNLYDALGQLDVVGRKYGGDFADDLKTQILFADELDNQFGAVARTSLAGETGKSIRRGLRESSLMELPVEAVARGADKLRNINDEQAFKTMEQLLRGE